MRIGLPPEHTDMFTRPSEALRENLEDLYREAAFMERLMEQVQGATPLGMLYERQYDRWRDQQADLQARVDLWYATAVSFAYFENKVAFSRAARENQLQRFMREKNQEIIGEARPLAGPSPEVRRAARQAIQDQVRHELLVH